MFYLLCKWTCKFHIQEVIFSKKIFSKNVNPLRPDTFICLFIGSYRVLIYQKEFWHKETTLLHPHASGNSFFFKFVYQVWILPGILDSFLWGSYSASLLNVSGCSTGLFYNKYAYFSFFTCFNSQHWFALFVLSCILYKKFSVRIMSPLLSQLID